MPSQRQAHLLQGGRLRQQGVLSLFAQLVNFPPKLFLQGALIFLEIAQLVLRLGQLPLQALLCNDCLLARLLRLGQLRRDESQARQQ